MSFSTAKLVASIVKLEHSVFALPFAFAGLIVAATRTDSPALTWQIWLAVTGAMVGARTTAMALNRVIDANIDARNPRTRSRELPSGVASRQFVWGIAVTGLLVLAVALLFLDPLTWVLWPIPVALFIVYPLTKRFTWLCHLVLGLTIGLAPLAAWIALRGDVGGPAIALSVASAAWITGFDIIYATADLAFDRKAGIQSLPARFGLRNALRVTAALHVVSVAMLVVCGAMIDAGPLYWAGVVICAQVLAYENSIVSEHDLSRADAAFFFWNGVVGVIFGTATIADQLLIPR